MSNKPRRIDYYPDEYIAGVGGRLNAADQGIYWMVCSLIYSRGGPIEDDHVWLSRLFTEETHWRTVRASLDRLIKLGKISRCEGGVITVTRCAEELQKARTRVAEASQNGRKGGRPPNENKEIEKADGSFSEKLTTNYQPPTIKKEKKHYAPSPKTSGASRGIEYPPAFETLWRAYKPIGSPNSTKADAHKAWEKLSPEERDACLAGLTQYVAWLSEEKQRRDGTKPKHLATFISKRGWEPFLEGRTLVPSIADEHPDISPEKLAEILESIERDYPDRRIR